MEILDRKVVYTTPYCSLIAKTICGQENATPFFGVRLPDYISILALTARREIILVKQFRPIVERETLELPSGCLEPGEDPKECARRELFEETGYKVNDLVELGWTLPDTGRLENRLGCYFAENAWTTEPRTVVEEGIEVVLCPPGELTDWILSGRIEHALHLAVFHLAVLHNKLPLSA